MADLRWIPVAERLPEGSGVACLVAIAVKGDEGEDTMASVADFHNGRFDVYDDKLEGLVTHWMPFDIPMPPSGAPGVEPHTEETRMAVIRRAFPDEYEALFGQYPSEPK